MTKSNFMFRNALARYTSIRSSSASGTTGHLPLKGEGSLSGFVLPTEISRLRRPEFTPFFARAKNGFAKKARSGDCAAK